MQFPSQLAESRETDKTPAGEKKPSSGKRRRINGKFAGKCIFVLKSKSEMSIPDEKKQRRPGKQQQPNS
jgi:hypothetical protein